MNQVEKILSFSPYAMWRLHALYEIAICHNLQWRGHTYQYVSCDGLFSDCDMFWEATLPRHANSCAICQAQVKPLLEDCRIPNVWLGKFKLPADIAAARNFEQGLKDAELLGAVFNGYPVGSWVKSSVHSHLRINAIDLTNPKHCRTLRSYLYSGAVAIACINRMLDDIQPTILLLFNGRLSVMRVALELARARGIRVVCHERGLKKETLLLWENEGCLALSPYSRLWDEWGQMPLEREQVSQVTQWLLDRARGANLNWKTFSVQSSLGVVAEFLAAHRGKKIWSLFTSSTDEIVADDDRTTVFGTQYRWIEETVAFVRNRPDVALVIRVHPNSGGGKSTGRNQEELAFFRNFQATLPSNVMLVMPDDQVSTYALIRRTDRGFVYGSTVALEMACRGIPVFLAARSPWMPCPSIQLITDPVSYHQSLEAATAASRTVEGSEKIALAAYRFAYAYVHRWTIPFPLVRMPDVHNGVLTAKTLEELKPGVHACLDYCTDIVLGARPSIPVATTMPQRGAEVEELEALRDGLESLVTEPAAPTGVRASVVITCYNYGKYLHDCVRSVARQTFRDFEVIVVNDGSTDDSQAVAEACLKEFPELRINLINQSNSGQPALARNAGIRQASGEFILPIDADDQIDPKYLEEAFAIIDADPGVDLVYSDSLIDNGHAQTRRKAGRFDMGSLVAANPIVYCSLYRRALWEKVGGYRDNVRGYEDWDFWIALGLAGAKAAHANCIGLLYNEKNSGVYSQTVAHHQNRVAQIILNNPAAYSPAQYRQARELLGLPPAPAQPVAVSINEFAESIQAAEALLRAGRLDEAIAKSEETLRLAPNPECATRAQEILDLLRAAKAQAQATAAPDSTEIFSPEEVQNILLLIANYTADPSGSNREQMIALQQGLMNFVLSNDALKLEAHFQGSLGEVFRAMAASALGAEPAGSEARAQLGALDEALTGLEQETTPVDFRPLLARMLCSSPGDPAPAFVREKIPGWVNAEYSAWLAGTSRTTLATNRKELCTASAN